MAAAVPAARIIAKGKLIQGMGGCSAYVEQKCFISGYDAATGKQLWKFHTVAIEGQPGGDTWGALSSLYRAGGETWITGSYDPDLNLTYWGTAQAKPWMPVSRGMYGARQGALHQRHRRARRRHRQAGVALPARARRSARSRRRVRARARRQRRPEPGVHGRQGRHPLEARSQDGQVPGPQGDGLPERVGIDRRQDRGARATARTSSTPRSASGSTAAPAPRAATTGRR